MLGTDSPPPIPLEVDDNEGDDAESLVEKDQFEERVVDKSEGEGESQKKMTPLRGNLNDGHAKNL